MTEEIGGAGTVNINAVRSSPKEAEKIVHTEYGYEPTVVDFIRRCETEAQALEIINFLEGRGGIEESYAERLRAQLKERGLRSFGKHRGPGCYENPETG